ncbi:MAG: tRNA (guanosine(46)-N7)-methyltransferase TrmB [Deltaproteobacteria bacterium]|nr:tRNA (guanosine(46)-N7)-methyltransferase TrmB [Deltaproteobacteria bacterium]
MKNNTEKRQIKQFPYDYEQKKEVLFYPPLRQGERETCLKGDILEIGPGRGDLLLAMATSQPDKKFVAVEIGKKRYFRLIPRIEKKGLKNILLIRGDARVIIPQFFGEATFEKIIVLFPDPWPKDRHAFRRLLQVEFLWLLAHHLKKGGEFVFGTDVEGYALWVVENLSGVQMLENKLAPRPYVLALPNLIPTFFEQKWRGMGKSIFFLSYRKKDNI